MLFLQRLLEHKKNRPHHPALISETRSLTYKALADRVLAGRNYLYAAGVVPHQVLGLSVADEIEHLVASLSLMACGVRQITLPTYENLTARQELAARAGVTQLLSDHDDAVSVSLRLVRWPGSAGMSLDAPSVNDDADSIDPAIIYLNTSGTTGGTNLIPFTEYQIALQAQRHEDYADACFLRLAPVEYNTSKRHRFYSLWNGGTNVFRPQGSLARVLEFARSCGVTCLDISKMHVSELIALNDTAALAQVKVRPGGAEIPAHERRLFREKLAAPLYVRYATTETGAIAMTNPLEGNDDETCGLPLPGVMVEIVGEQGELLTPGRLGEIRLKAPGMATGYLDNPGQTDLRFRAGWFYPGDVGSLLEDGRIVVNGRKDDMIILNGINIFPADIESVLEKHPDVRAAAALPLESAVHGQIPVAAVQLEAGAQITAQQLQHYAREHLAIRAPRRIIVLDVLPRNKQGKLLRKEIGQYFERNEI